jgi:rod shape-determining protein MreC
VARVIRVERNSRYAFASIFCEPIAGVERHRFVLVLDTFRENVTAEPAPAASAPTPNAPIPNDNAATPATTAPANNTEAGNGN